MSWSTGSEEVEVLSLRASAALVRSSDKLGRSRGSDVRARAARSDHSTNLPRLFQSLREEQKFRPSVNTTWMSGQAGNTNNPTITARFQTSPVIPWFSANAVVRPSECVARPLRSKLIGFRSCAMELPGKIQILIKPTMPRLRRGNPIGRNVRQLRRHAANRAIQCSSTFRRHYCV